MRIVITGATGFIGKALLYRLRKLGLDVIGVSRTIGYGNIVVEKYADAPVGDVLVHLAEASNRLEVNALGTLYRDEQLETINRLIKKRYKKIIYASSALVYKNGLEPYSESVKVAPVDNYTFVKLMTENMITQAGGVAVRFSNIYGTGMSPATVVSSIFKQINLSGPLTLGDSAAVRDFLWIDDAVDAIVRMIIEPAYGIINIGTGVGTSIHNLATLVLNICKQPDRIISATNSNSSGMGVVLNVEKAAKLLGWRPNISLNSGLMRMYKEYST